MSIVGPQNSLHPSIAAFDLGSNTIKMTVARASGNRGIDEYLSRSETVRLGQNIEATGSLAADRIAAALDTLGRFATEARAAGATRLIGVATEATRVASNGPAFLDRVRHEMGIEIHTISGDREAELTFLGLDGVVDLGGRVAVADIGGGSTELIFAEHRSIVWSRSFALGSGRLTDRFVNHDPPIATEIAACRDAARRTVADAPFEHVTGGRLIVVGGTGEYLDRLIPGEPPHGPDAFQDVFATLESTTASDLSAELAISEARARVLPAGVAIARGIADVMRPDTFEAAQSGIRRGLLLSAFAGEI